MQRVLELDPSPTCVMLDAEYVDLFSNMIVNMNVPEMSMLKMYPPASVHAVVHDHHYLNKAHETYVLELLQIIAISDEQIHTI